MFTKYIDQKTNEGYAAIHFASYKGNLVIFFCNLLKYLIFKRKY